MAYNKIEMEECYKKDYTSISNLEEPSYQNFSDVNYDNIAQTISSSVTSEWNSQSSLSYASNAQKLGEALNKIPKPISRLQKKCKILFEYKNELKKLSDNIDTYNEAVESYNTLEAKIAAANAAKKAALENSENENEGGIE